MIDISTRKRGWLAGVLETSRRAAPRGMLLITMLIASSAICTDSSPEPPGRVSVISSAPDGTLDALLKPRRYGWLGADGAYSIRLSDTRLLWLFMDTFVGGLTAEGGRRARMVNNSVAVQDMSRSGPQSVRFYWGGSGESPASFFPPPPDGSGSYYWPFSGVLAGGRLYLLFVTVTHSGGDGPFAFSTGESVLAVVSNPQDSPPRWEYSVQPLGFGGKDGHFVSAACAEKGFLYLLGSAETAAGKSSAILARALFADLDAGKGGSAFEFWSDGDGRGEWTRSRERLRPLFVPSATEGSLYRDDRLGCFVAVVQPGLSGDVCVVLAPRLTGPWSKPEPVFRLPPGHPDDFSYAGKAHPALAGPEGDIVFTYVTNSFKFERLMRESGIYYPRFARARIAVEEH